MWFKKNKKVELNLDYKIKSEELEKENIFLKDELKNIKEDFDFSALWNDDLPGQSNLIPIISAVISFIVLLIVIFKN